MKKSINFSQPFFPRRRYSQFHSRTEKGRNVRAIFAARNELFCNL